MTQDGPTQDRTAQGMPLPSKASDPDCSAVLGRVFFFLDNELEQADCAEIQQHLDECGPCLARYDLERTVKTLVARFEARTLPVANSARVTPTTARVASTACSTMPG